MIKYIPICLLLAACNYTMPTKQAPIFDARLMERCAELPEARISSFEDVLIAKASETQLYVKCKNTHSGLVDAIKEYQKEFNK